MCFTDKTLSSCTEISFASMPYNPIQVLRIPILVLNFRIQHPKNSEALTQTPPISGQKSFPRWCPLIRESTVIRISLKKFYKSLQIF